MASSRTQGGTGSCSADDEATTGLNYSHLVPTVVVDAEDIDDDNMPPLRKPRKSHPISHRVINQPYPMHQISDIPTSGFGSSRHERLHPFGINSAAKNDSPASRRRTVISPRSSGCQDEAIRYCDSPYDNGLSSSSESLMSTGGGAACQATFESNPFTHDHVKRIKNREAAARCRMRKCQRVMMLEEKAKQLQQLNEDLEKEAGALRIQIQSIMFVLSDHVRNGCPIPLLKSIPVQDLELNSHMAEF